MDERVNNLLNPYLNNNKNIDIPIIYLDEMDDKDYDKEYEFIYKIIS